MSGWQKMYDLFIEAEAHEQRKRLPGNVRQRIGRAIHSLSQSPRPSASEPLDVSGLNVPSDIEMRRIRLDRWRIVYAINDAEGWVWVWRIRRRPPYDYDDLVEFVEQM